MFLCELRTIFKVRLSKIGQVWNNKVVVRKLAKIKAAEPRKYANIIFSVSAGRYYSKKEMLK